MIPTANMQHVLEYYRNIGLPKDTIVLHITYSSFGIFSLQYVKLCMDPANGANSCKPFLAQGLFTHLRSPIEA